MKTFAPDSLDLDTVSVVSPLPQKGDNILVIGSGVLGAWTALLLQRNGFKVSISDPWGPGNSRSSSGGESRLMRKLYGSNAFYTQMALDSIPLWKDLEHRMNRKLYVEEGIYWFIKNQHDPFLYSDGELHPFLNGKVSPISKESATKKLPGVVLDDIYEILFEDQAGYIKARESVMTLQELFLNEGGYILSKSLKPGNNSNGSLSECIDVNGVKIKSDFFVFACGPWNVELFPNLFSRKMIITRQEVFYFGYPEDYNSSLPCWVELDPENLFYGIPNLANRGFKIALDERGPEIDPSREERMISKEAVDRYRSFLVKRFPFLRNSPVIESRVCQYSNTPSGNLLMINHPEMNNVWILGAGNGHGFKHGPGIGELFSEVMAGNSGVPRLLQQI